MFRDSGKEGGTHPADPIQSLQAAEGATGLTVCDDAFREARPHSRQAGDLCRVGPIDVNFLARPEGPSERHRALLVGEGGLGWQRPDQLDVSRRLTWRREHGPDGVAGYG
jgi:hypothetical protein